MSDKEPDLRVIKRKRLPTKLPITPTVLYYVMLDFYNAPGWLWGIAATLFMIVWAIALYLSFYEEEEDIL